MYLRLHQGRHTELSVPAGRTLALVVLLGTVVVNGDHVAEATQLVLLDPAGSDVSLDAKSDATMLLLSGEPIDEPEVSYGPFVMNTPDEINQAVRHFNSGRFGQVREPEHRK